LLVLWSSPGLCQAGDDSAGDGASSAAADETAEAAEKDETIQGGLHIGIIFFDRMNIFDVADPEQNRRVYRWANRLHMVTREESLKNQLLIQSGDLFSVDRMEESERALRTRAGLYDAKIEVVAIHDGVADLAVHTRDVWTLSGGFQFGRSGGENHSGFELKDKNFLGLGKNLRLKRSSDVDRTSTSFGYEDPNLAGTRNQLAVSYSDNSDGEEWSLHSGRPFFELDSHWGASVIAEHEDRLDRRYLRGEAVDVFRHDRVKYELGGGLSRGLQNGKSHRFLFGMTYQEDSFVPAAALDEEDPLPSGRLPEQRILAYPWIGYEFLRDSFVEETNLDLIDRTEDRYRGVHATARLGYSSSAFSGDRSRWVFQGVLSNSWQFDQRQLLEASISGAGRYGRGGFENTVADVFGRYYLRQSDRWLLFVRLGAEAATDLDYDQQLLLGGENGLRGYPLRYQDGDRRVLFTVEERLFTDWKPFKLFNVGAAAFLDAGRAWFPGEDNGAYGDVLSNVGVGLRLGNSRAHGTIVHLDLAFPIGGDPAIKSVQWLVSSRRSF
jgi:hemolysin activation/secretion protein